MQKKFRKFIEKFFLINDTPHKIAGGAALGMFLGIVPGEGVLTTLLFASIFRLNRLAAVAGVMATNMWATVVILPFAAAIGGFLFGESREYLISEFNRTYHLGFKFFLSKAILFDLVFPLVAGFFIVAGAIALFFYFILLYLIKNNKKNND